MIVTRGKIKVDARKAITKLRDHLLVDLHLYATELARVAVAVGATSLAIEWDADDVILTFDGGALPAEAVARARDHVLTPESAVADGDALRVLGIGVSAALGLDPSFVDVYTSSAASCARIRFLSKHIDEDASADTPEPIEVPFPSGMPRPGMRVHVRRRTDFQMLARAVRGDGPREVSLLVAATRDAPIVVTVNGVRVQRPPGPVVLARVDLDEPSVTRASLEVLVPVRGARPHTLFLELGLHLAESAGIGLRQTGDSELPVRVVIDARKLPTNASRSEVRTDADVVQRICSRVPAALAAALSALEAVALRGEAPPGGTVSTGHSVQLFQAPRELYEEALGAIAADVAITLRAGTRVTDAEAALMKLPLLCDAAGGPLALADIRGGTPDQPILVYTGKTAAPPELAAWLRHVVWQRGRAVERAIWILAQASANEHVAQAHQGLARRRRAMEHPPSRAILSSSSSYVVKEAFAVREGPFAGLEGEVAVMQREGSYRRASTARLFVDERLLETVQLPGVALPLDMALAWPNGFTARRSYDAVERDERVSQAIVYALRVAAYAVGERLGPRDPELVRLSISACVSATETLGDVSPARSAARTLAQQAVWPATDGSLLSLATIEAYSNRTGVLCVARAGAGRAADGRPVVVAEHGKTLLGLLRENTRLVDYSRALAQGDDEVAEALALHSLGCVVRMTFKRDNVEGVIGVGPNRRRILHRGMLLQDEAFTFRNGPVLIVLDDRTAVPSPDFTQLLWSSSAEHGTAREEDALVEHVVDLCERGELALATVVDYVTTARRKLGERLRAGRHVENAVWATTLVKRLEELPRRLERTRLERAKAVVLARPPRLAVTGALSATVVTDEGTVTAMLLRADDARVGLGEVSFKGHPIDEVTLLDFATFIRVDLTSEAFLKEWTSLTDGGMQWIRATATQATLKLLGDLACEDGFTTDLEALRLCERLLMRDVTARSPVTALLRAARWPTVQGGWSTLASGTLPVGKVAYVPYRAAKDASPYDAPSVHLPPTPVGELRRSVLTRAAFELVDQTEPIARLQALRARGMEHEQPPALPGVAAHPQLRGSLAKLGATCAEGELELIDGAASEIVRVDTNGAAEAVALALYVPVRAIFRAGQATAAQIAEEIGTTTTRLLREVGARGGLDALPLFVRDRLRLLVCSCVAHRQRSAADESYPVFADKEGAFWSLAQLIEHGDVRRTRDPGVWAIPQPSAPIFVLSDEEAHALSSVLRSQDVTEELRVQQRGAARRAAPPLDSVALSADQRARCLFTFVVDANGIRGEVGLLRPAYAAQRGLAVHTTMRPLLTIEDGPAWPLVAAVDVEGLEPNAAFDAPEDRAQIKHIRLRVRAAVSARAVDILPAPSDAEAIGVVRLPVPFLARRADAASTDAPVPCLGIFWLTPEWPESPAVHVEASTGIDPFRLPYIGERANAHHRLLPIAGRVWVCADERRVHGALELMFDFLLDRLPAILASSSRPLREAAPEQRAAYLWDLRLLGVRTDEDPVQELARDRPDPVLLRVAARRAPHLIDAATGDAPAAATAPPVAPTPVRAALPDPSSPPAESFLAGLVRRVVELVTPAPEAVSASPLSRSLETTLTAMKLTGDPVSVVVEAKRGRPVRYDGATKRVVVNTSHASVRALEAHPSRVLLLTAAAVSEINRELEHVTDAEELTVVVNLLRDG